MSLMSDLIREEQEKDQRGARKAIAVGTWGGNGGTNWDDGNYNAVKEIPIMRAGIVYDKNGKPILAERHGGVEGSKTAEELGKDQNGEKKKAIFIGPWGGPGGNYWDDESCTGVREITLTYGHCIDSMRILYEKNGIPVLSEKHGGPGGNANAEVKLQFPYEYLTAVSGYCSPLRPGDNTMVRSLTFKSNWRTFGPFGVETGTPFSLPMEGGKIVGFRGRCGSYIDNIGFYISHA